MKNKILYISIILFVTSFNLHAQKTGINTYTPDASLDVLTIGIDGTTKALEITNSASQKIFTLLDNATLGLLNTSPTHRMDISVNTDNKSIIGIGPTNQTAAQAESGAIRYNSTTQKMQYSDGNRWITLESPIPRASVIADNNYNRVDVPDRTTTVLTSWSTIYDPNSSFNAATGIFTAPKDGYYMATYSVYFFIDTTPIAANSYIEGVWTSSSGKTVRCIQAFPENTKMQIGIICSGTFYLSQNETLTPTIWHNVGSSRHLRVYGDTSIPITDTGFNNISILIQ